MALFRKWHPATAGPPGVSYTEVTVSEAGLEWTARDVRAAVGEFVERLRLARAPGPSGSRFVLRRRSGRNHPAGSSCPVGCGPSGGVERWSWSWVTSSRSAVRQRRRAGSPAITAAKRRRSRMSRATAQSCRPGSGRRQFAVLGGAIAVDHVLLNGVHALSVRPVPAVPRAD